MPSSGCFVEPLGRTPRSSSTNGDGARGGTTSLTSSREPSSELCVDAMMPVVSRASLSRYGSTSACRWFLASARETAVFAVVGCEMLCYPGRQLGA